MAPNGFAFMWVYKPLCPACGKARLKKPKKTAKFYACEACKKEFEKPEYNKLLAYNIEYTCPACGKKGLIHGEWEKPGTKTSKVMVKFECEHCGEKNTIYRMSKLKKKKKK
ncbi:hypothetical protein COS83_00675 [archaeon CG07_land_8_20_14_0_80_38_8]|nr:MAG: hypothetical protein COS83_00675 [archaeon CG07_land_8_20_14_0_80_38_8]PIU88260.1 MAG: hypothetical protein COS64_04460 [archaeon CG06_land_8_20_14_3_00_37_11]